MTTQKYRRDDFTISTDKSLLNLGVIQEALKQSYWANNVPYEMIETAIQHSLCFGMYHQHRQIGFARVVTDFSTMAYITDLFILDDYEKETLSEWLMEYICSYPELKALQRWLLASKDGMYAPFHFSPVEALVSPKPQDIP